MEAGSIYIAGARCHASLGVAVAEMKYLLMVITQYPPPVVRKNKNVIGKRVTKIIPPRGEKLPTGAKGSLGIPQHSDLLAKVRSLRAKPRTAFEISGNCAMADIE